MHFKPWYYVVMTDVFSVKKRSEIMSRVKNKDTSIEIKLRKELWKRGFRYRKNSHLLGKPDIVLAKEKIVIFCDGEFWHGRYFDLEGKNYPSYWQAKVRKNMDRDDRINRQLKDTEWKVLRFWERDINKNLESCVEKIISLISK